MFFCITLRRDGQRTATAHRRSMKGRAAKIFCKSAMFETLSFPARRAATRTNARASQLLVCLGFQLATLRRISGFHSAYPAQPRRARSAPLAPFNFGPPVQPCPTRPAQPRRPHAPRTIASHPLNPASPFHPMVCFGCPAMLTRSPSLNPSNPMHPRLPRPPSLTPSTPGL